MQALQPIKPKDRDPNLVFIGMPSAKGGLWDLARTIISLELGVEELKRNGVKTRFIFRHATGQGVAKARNNLTFAARCTPASKVIFVDSDVPLTPAHVFRLLSHDAHLVGALYPKKNYQRLCWVGEFDECTPEKIGPGGLWPMMSVGSGAIKFDLSVVDELVAAYPEREFVNDEDEPKSGLADGQLMHDLWGMGVVTDTWFGSPRHPGPRRYARYTTEDYFFSYLYRKAGGKLWTDPGCQVGHVGDVDFLELHADVARQIEEALVRYKRDLESVGVHVPALVRSADPGAPVRRVN